jgi:hypothetical protein
VKVVINACFGGFSLSPAGAAAYLARQGKPAFFYVEDRESSARPGDRDYVRVGEPEARAAFMFTTLSEDIGERVPSEVIWPGRNAHPAYWDDRDIERDDPDLVAIVEADAETVSGNHAKLQVVEIPDDVAWEIEEYDGLERVAEQHRTWSS